MISARVYQNRLDRVSDELLWLRRCRQGDETALALLIERHRERVTRIAYNILRDAYEAEDVAQESFLKAFRELKSLRDDRAFAGFLNRIAVRRCMDRLRSRREAPTEFDSLEPDEGGRIEDKLLIEKLLAQLPPELRATLVLREIEQLSYEEVAKVMDVPIGTVRSRLHAARERFRTLWIHATGEVR